MLVYIVHGYTDPKRDACQNTLLSYRGREVINWMCMKHTDAADVTTFDAAAAAAMAMMTG